MNFDHIKTILSSEDLDIDLLEPAEAPPLHQAGYPDDYISFLLQVGYGYFGVFQLYSSPADSDSIYPANTKHLQDIMLIGDDHMGYCFGFDRMDNMRLVGIDPRGSINKNVEPDFETFIRNKISSGFPSE